MQRLHIFILLLGLLFPATHSRAARQLFFNLSATEVRVDSTLPHFVYTFPLEGHYADSLYTVRLGYPEFVDLSPAEVRAYQRLSGEALPALPVPTHEVSLDRKSASLIASFCPLVFRNGHYQVLVSFMLTVEAVPLKRVQRRTAALTSTPVAQIYAAHSVLAKGRWAKISVPDDGVYQLTEALIRKAGFTDINKVRVFGYGGHLQPEAIKAAYLAQFDDLKEVPQCVIGGRHLFYGKGTVSWSCKTAQRRTRNPYAQAGCYFLTQGEEAPLTQDSAAFVSSFYPSATDYHSLYEVDGYSWYHGGRNLFDPHPIAQGKSQKVVLNNVQKAKSGQLTVRVTAGSNTQVAVAVNGERRKTLDIHLYDYDKGSEASATMTLNNLHATDTVTLTILSGGPARLDDVSMSWNTPRQAPLLSKVTAVPDYLYNITNQDHHADGFADMVILIPTSQKLLAQAERLKKFHETHDNMRVNIVPADELYNEFSSGTPDINAYRRYLKMLYDRATTEADRPKYFLYMGDCLWDNRMLTPEGQQLNADDYLLCYESENSFNEVTCYVDDSWVGLLDEGEGANPVTEQIDVAVGRFPVTTAAQAKVMVDKTIAYANNAEAGNWQNTLVFMGDDGNENLHMRDEDEVANYISELYPGYVAKKVMWDVYTRQSSSTGNSYPEVATLLKQQQAEGALIMDYAGHGSEVQISHEAVLRLSDFASFTGKRWPLWITASCDIMPFDGTTATIGETAVLNERGGTMAFYGTTRTVYANLNKYMNRAFLRRVLSFDTSGKPTTLGEAHRLAQNDLVKGRWIDAQHYEADRSSNRLQYALLGDPALALHLPRPIVVVDSIGGRSLNNSSDTVKLSAGSVVRVKGHLQGAPSFTGTVYATVRDSREIIVGKMNNEKETSTAFSFYDRPRTLFSGADSVRNGQFSFSFAVPRDINYTDTTGLMNLLAVSNDQQLLAHGVTDKFLIGGTAPSVNDSVGPSVYAYLNTPSFVNGDQVNTTPYFVAQISDADGLNTSGSGIGHDLELVVDGDPAKTYLLNSHFVYDFGSYTSGSTWYSLPELAPGKHTLRFRAWDILNNVTTCELNFNVVRGLEPKLFNVSCTENPARSQTTFIIQHDRTASPFDVQLEIFDLSGRLLWQHDESGVSADGAYTMNWNLTVNGGSRLNTGVYLYRVKVSSNGSTQASKAKKLVVINNN